MAEVTGPISTLPGTAHHLPDGTMCDEHPDRPAIARIQGETDSFGSELNDLCAECLEEDRQYERSEKEAFPCDCCKVPSSDRRPQRDSDEGLYGRVYYVCKACRDKYRERMRAEADEFDDRGDYDRDYDDHSTQLDMRSDDPEVIAVAVEGEVKSIKLLAFPADILCKFCTSVWGPGHDCDGLRRRRLIRELTKQGKPA